MDDFPQILTDHCMSRCYNTRQVKDGRIVFNKLPFSPVDRASGVLIRQMFKEKFFPHKVVIGVSEYPVFGDAITKRKAIIADVNRLNLAGWWYPDSIIKDMIWNHSVELCFSDERDAILCKMAMG